MTRWFGALTAGLVCFIWCAPARGDDAGFLSAYAIHDSFSQDTFYAVDITKPFGPPDPLRPFAELTLQRDSRTTGGILPQTLNDNYGLLAAGVQLQSNSGLRVFAQVGTSFNVGPAIQALPTSSHLDARGGADYYRAWNDPPEGKNRYYGTFFSNFLYYSRYQNALLYFEATRGLEFGSRKSPVQTYVRVSGSQDTKRFYYNDVVAFSTGAQILPLGRRGVTIGVEETFSAYTGAPLIPGDTSIVRSYWSFRPQITYGASF
jgi:hypothetical protein